MAKAFKCDICGDLYASYNDDGPNAIKLVRSKLFTNSAVVLKYYDCCPACMATLKETIALLGENKENGGD